LEHPFLFFFKTFPKKLSADFISNDSIFPWYIISQLPDGVFGILIAAICSINE